MNQEKLSSLFTTMSEISAKKLCKEMEFRHLKGGEVVVNQGEKGNTCFVSFPPSMCCCLNLHTRRLCCGVCSSLTRDVMRTTDPRERPRVRVCAQSGGSEEVPAPDARVAGPVKLQASCTCFEPHLDTRECSQPFLSELFVCLLDLLQSSDFGPVNYGAKVVTLTPGATFGELCLIEPDSKRSATVIVDPQAQVANFIVLTAASYLRMTRSQTIEGTITDHISFLQHMLVFRKWSKMRACLGFVCVFFSLIPYVAFALTLLSLVCRRTDASRQLDEAAVRSCWGALTSRICALAACHSLLGSSPTRRMRALLTLLLAVASTLGPAAIHSSQRH